MNYKEWLEKTLSEMIHEKDDSINLKVYTESNARFDGDVNDCTIVINGLGGTTDSNDVQVVPVQLMVLTGGQYEENENGNTAYDVVFETLKEFCQKYNKQSIVLNDFDYYRHSYVQPFPVNPLEQDSGTFRINFVVSGTLTISQQINDINKISINGKEIKFLRSRLVYATALSPSGTINQKHTRNVVQTSSLTLFIETYNRTDYLSELMKSIRKERVSQNTSFKCKIEFSDTSEEEYSCIISENVIDTDRINPSGATYTLVLS